VRALTSAVDAQELDRVRAAFDQRPPTPGGSVDPSTVVVARAGGDDGEAITDRPGRRVTLLVDRDELALTETVYGPGETGPEPHVHHDHVDAFVVLEGRLTFTLRSGEVHAPAGTFVLVPPDVVHTFRNADDADARFFNLHAPSCGFGDHLRGRHPGFDQHAVGDDVVGADPAGVVVRALDPDG
jgi:mannose-6-phosphate isomerase-like protein (cupin superfamily)